MKTETKRNCLGNGNQYLWDGKWISEDEIEEIIADLSVYELEELSCESKIHTLQMLALSRNVADKADILYIKRRTA